MTKAQEKKVFYNRVRRACAKHGVDIVYDGVPKNYVGVELIKDGKVLADDWASDYFPLDINWKRIYEEIEQQGIRGGHS